jgi:molybdopterin/thiamine biosynthesis adenylyltransferase/molybdopterin synthase catalytic subunit/rhodanese-related sulfurtransferase
MQPFAFTGVTIEPERLRTALEHPAAGGYASFEGWVRDHNDGRSVRHLEYEAYETLALREGERIVAEAVERFGVLAAACVHRVGDLAIGELAVWVGVSSAHRAEAFAACRYIIDEVKHRVPIWKKEHYIDGDSGWVNCEACATAGGEDHGDASHHERRHDQATGHAHRDVDRPGAPRFVPDYSRQIALPDVGQRGQDLLEAASVLVVGAGGLGVPVLQYLVAAGVGRIGIADGDRVDASNLQRQPLYAIDDVGEPKAAVAARHLARINPTVDLVVHGVAVDDTNVDELVADYDLIVECTDNFRSKFRLNDALVRHGKPAVFASVYQYEGQLQIYRPTDDWPCLRCLWPDAPLDGLIGNCAEAGVLGPVPGTLGAMQAMQALRMLLGHDEDSLPALTVVDLTSLSTRRVLTRRNPECRHDRTLRAPAQSRQPIELEFSTLAEARASGLELIDIREGWERAADPPALRIERHLALSDLMEGRVGWPGEGRYLIVCAHGVRSLALTERLRELGHAQVWSMRGGLAAIAD